MVIVDDKGNGGVVYTMPRPVKLWVVILVTVLEPSATKLWESLSGLSPVCGLLHRFRSSYPVALPSVSDIELWARENGQNQLH